MGSAGSLACAAAGTSLTSTSVVLDVVAPLNTAVPLTVTVSSAVIDPVPAGNSRTHPVSVTTDGSDSVSTATALSGVPVRLKDRLYPSGDVDYYSFAAAAGDRVYAAVMAAGNINPKLTLLAANGTTEIEVDDDDGTLGPLSPSIAGAHVPAAGTYYLKVENASSVASGIGAYDLYLDVRSGTPTPDVEPGGTLPSSRWVSGFIADAFDSDSFTFDVNAGDTVFVSLDMDPATAGGVRAGGTRWNGSLTLTPEGGAALSATDANNVSPNSEALFAAFRTAGRVTLTVAATSGAGELATYHLNVAIIPAPAETCTTYTSTDVPKTVGPNPVAGGVRSTITVPDNVRVARVAVQMTLTHANLADLDITLKAPGGTEIPVVTDQASTDSATATLRLDEARGAFPISSISVGLSAFVVMPTSREMLSWFAGDRAQGEWTLTVRDDAPGNSGSLVAWSLTICPEVAASCPVGTQPQPLLSTDFETGDGGFTHAGVLDEWEWGTPSSSPITTCGGGTKCWKTDLDSRYEDYSAQALFSPTWVVPATAAAVLVEWSHRHQLETLRFDGYAVDLVDAAQAPLRRLYQMEDGLSVEVVGTDSIEIAAGWARRRATLTGVAGQTLGLRWRMDSDSSITRAGVAVDDVTVSACVPPADLSITKTGTPDPVSAGGTLTYALNVSNAGPSVATGVQVTDTLPVGTTFLSATAPADWTLTTPAVGASGTVTATKTSMAVGESLGNPLLIAVRVPVASLALTNTAAVTATGSADPDPSNNTASTTTMVLSPPSITITTPTTGATYAASQAFVTLAGTASDATGIAAVTWVSNRGPSGTASGTTAWTAAQIPLSPGANVITVTARDADTPSSTATATITVTVGSLSYYLAEGATGAFWDLDILIANPNPVEAPVTITFLKEDASTVTVRRTLLPTSRTTIPADAIVGLEQTATSAVVTSTAGLPLVVERSMFWDAGYYGSHGGTAVSGPSTRWYFAEGSQGMFDTYVLLANANGAAATATVQFLTEYDGVVTRVIDLPPTSRTNVVAGAIPELVNKSFSIVVDATLPIIAERAMYFGPGFKGGHESMGVTEPSASWFLAEGSTGLFTTYVLVGNPNTTPANVTLTYLLDTGQVIVRPRVMGPNSRLTVPLSGEAAAMANVAVSTTVTADVPVIAERAMYWPSNDWGEAHNSFGVTETALKWGLAEGRVGGPQHFATYILLANPNATAAQVRITYLRTDGTTVTKDYDGGCDEPIQRARECLRAGTPGRALRRGDRGAQRHADRRGTGDVQRRRGRERVGRRHQRDGDAVAIGPFWRTTTSAAIGSQVWGALSVRRNRRSGLGRGRLGFRQRPARVAGR